MKAIIIRRLDAVAPVISAIMVILIVSITMGSIVVWGVPYVNSLRDAEVFDSAKLQFNSIVDTIEELINEDSGTPKVSELDIQSGYISTDKDVYDRTVITYSTTSDADYNFSVGRVSDDTFQVSMDGVLSSGEGYWLNVSGEIVHTETLNPTVVDGDTWEFDAPALYPFTGLFPYIVNISLYSNNYQGGNYPFGNISIFDSNNLTYTFSSSIGTNKLAVEKGGLIYIYDTPSDALVKRMNGFLTIKTGAREDVVKIGVVQMNTSASKASDAGSGFKVRININSSGSYIREMRRVYYFRFQFYGGNAPAWLDYFYNNYHFSGSPDNSLFSKDPNNNLFYRPSDPVQYPQYPDGIWFIPFSHSILNLDISSYQH